MNWRSMVEDVSSFFNVPADEVAADLRDLAGRFPAGTRRNGRDVSGEVRAHAYGVMLHGGHPLHDAVIQLSPLCRGDFARSM